MYEVRPSVSTSKRSRRDSWEPRVVITFPHGRLFAAAHAGKHHQAAIQGSRRVARAVNGIIRIRRAIAAVAIRTFTTFEKLLGRVGYVQLLAAFLGTTYLVRIVGC